MAKEKRRDRSWPGAEKESPCLSRGGSQGEGLAAQPASRRSSLPPERVRSHTGCACPRSRVPEEPFQQLPCAGDTPSQREQLGKERPCPARLRNPRASLHSVEEERKSAESVMRRQGTPLGPEQQDTAVTTGMRPAWDDRSPTATHWRKRHDCILLLEYEGQGAFALQTPSWESWAA